MGMPVRKMDDCGGIIVLHVAQYNFIFGCVAVLFYSCIYLLRLQAKLVHWMQAISLVWGT